MAAWTLGTEQMSRREGNGLSDTARGFLWAGGLIAVCLVGPGLLASEEESSLPDPSPSPLKVSLQPTPSPTPSVSTNAQGFWWEDEDYQADYDDSGCDSNYTGCVPIASDVDCASGSGNGPEYVEGPVEVIGSDIYGLDGDGDGYGCE